jgi:hypothetical protein
MSAEDLKAKYIKEVGEWTEEEQALLELDPTYFEAATELLALPARKGHLSPKGRSPRSAAIQAEPRQSANWSTLPPMPPFAA